ncbi:MAG TPA: TonB-dependent siderophore receptor [Xanthomonadaceae bacterium]|nr:TonB-dependent siderophore receptor [Xanthomonadaceae bacterium]
MLTLAISGAVLAATGSVPALAQEDGSAVSARDYDIPAGPLADGLRRLGSSAGVLLIFTGAQTEGRSSPGLHGRYSLDEAFSRLLEGSGLRAIRAAGGGYVLGQAASEPPPRTGAVAEFPTLQVVARASPAPVEADDSYKPTPDASTLRSTAAMLDVPQVVNVVSAQVIRDQRPRTLDDVLTNVSGITQGNTLAGTQDTIMKRGFGGNRDGSIMHNGMPLVQGHGMNAAAESVELLKGPSSLLYGIMDPGGVVNVVSKKPRLEAKNTLSLSASGYAGARNGSGATLDSTGPLGASGLAYRVILDHVDEDYWRNFGTHRETLFAPSLAWYGQKTQAVVWYEYRNFLIPFDRGTALDPVTDRPLAIPKTRRLDEPFNQMEGESHLLQASVDHRLGGDWAAHASASYNRETYDANQLRVNGVDAAAGTLVRSNDATHGALSTDSYGTAYLDGSVEWGGLRHALQLGVDAEYRRIYRRDLLRESTTATFSYLDPVYGQEVPSRTVSASDSDQTDTLHNQSLFLQDTVNLGERWIVTGGVRYLAWQQVAGRGRPFKANTDIDSSKWLPRLGAIYKLTPELSAYGSYTQSLKPASSIAPLSGGTVIDSGLKPEEAESWEMGLKYDDAGTISGSLALFNIDKKNVLVQQYNDQTKLTDWRTSGAARSRGVELDLAGRIDEHWSVIASAALIDARTTEDPDYAGNRLWNVARQTASLSAVYDAGPVFGSGRVRVGGGGRYVGKRPGDSANSFELPAYSVADLFASYDTRLGRHPVKVQINVKNLFDRTYYTSSVNKYFVSMGDARQILLQAVLDF